MKTCKTCGETKSLEEFPIGRGNADGRRPHCNKCHSTLTSLEHRSKRDRERTEQGRPEIRTHARSGCDEIARQHLCHGCLEVKFFEDFPPVSSTPCGYSTRCKECRYFERALLWYSITREDYLWLLERQDGSCRWCAGQNKSGSRLSVEHDHACCGPSRACKKCIRSLACQRCNRLIGDVETSPMMSYMEGSDFARALEERPFLSTEYLTCCATVDRC